jgi:hypothetical protein
MRRASLCQRIEDAKISKNLSKQRLRYNSMSLTRGKSFIDSEEAQDIRRILQQMTLDSTYSTVSSYSADSLTYPDNLMPFIDKHMNYLNAHPKVEASKYLANIKLMTRKR